METGQWVDGDQYNGRIVFIANSFVFKEPVYNYSGDFRFLWDEIKIPIRFGSNYSKAAELLEKAGRDIAGDLTQASRTDWKTLQHKYRLEDAQTDPMVSVVANENWVELTLRYVVNYKRRRITKTQLYTRILREFEATGDEIKFASNTFSLIHAPELNVKVKNTG
jgi:small-conductance mechanosensitive channel